MSRIGKLPVKLPSGVTVKVDGRTVEIKGAKGTLTKELPAEVGVEVADGVVNVVPALESENTKALWGLYRVLINNMVVGVSAGYKIELEVHGVGYKVELKGKDLLIAAGLSDTVLFKARPGLEYKTEGTVKMSVEGIDKEKVGQAAADIRRIRPPEPYKGKGIRYVGENIRRKAGKTAGK
ncbi:MAG: 50S ribosomal protein L6 [Chitinispirillales bacterium]|nr:50S ribosomal protein L6 [Chitinispirillales bacterium]